MGRLRHTLLGLFAAIGLTAGGGSSDLLEPSLAQARQEGTILMAAQTPAVYDFTLNDINGKPVSLSQFRGKVLLLVNTASFCGNTPQYTDLEKMYEQYREKGFEILAFPLFSKIGVKGDNKHPLYRYLTEQSQFPGEVEWNFQKYLVDRSGKIVARYHHRTKPLAPEIVQDVERVLAAH
jgi:glutathione peroxidase